jgi:hypothetical protein
MFLACIVGYGWLALIAPLKPEEIATSYDVCLVRHFVHIPCPSCGSTRSVLSLMRGDLAGALYWNPFGLLIFCILVFSPFWMAFDFIFRKESLYRFFLLFENTLRRKAVAIPAILLVLINWAWNIWKGV